LGAVFSGDDKNVWIVYSSNWCSNVLIQYSQPLGLTKGWWADRFSHGEPEWVGLKLDRGP
jgi:hypothetical protein